MVEIYGPLVVSQFVQTPKVLDNFNWLIQKEYLVLHNKFLL